MSKKSTESLYDLICSLTKSEKRYFKLLSSRHTIGEENNYVVLFDYLDKLSEYDEGKLFEHFKGEAFLNKFSITKKRLYDHILNALTQFHASNHVEATIYQMLHSSKILFDKALYNQAKNVLRSAEKLAVKHSLTHLLIEIRNQSKRIIEKNNYFDFDLASIEEIEAKDYEIQQQSLHEVQLWHVKSKIFNRLSHQGPVRTEKDSQFYQELFETFQNITAPFTLSFESSYLQNHIQSVYYFAQNDMQLSYQFLKRNRELFQANELQISRHVDRYFSILTNLVYTADKLGLDNEATSYLVELREVHRSCQEQTAQDIRFKFFATLASIELTYLAKRGLFDQLTKKIPFIEAEIEQFDQGISILRKAFLYFKISSIQLILGNHHEALKNVRKILNDTTLDKKDDIVSYSHLLEIVIHLELKNEEIIPHLIKKTSRFLKAKNRIGVLEKTLLNFFSRLIQLRSSFDRLDKWGELKLKLLALQKEQNLSEALDYFHWITFAESKSSGQSFAQIVQKQQAGKINPAA